MIVFCPLHSLLMDQKLSRVRVWDASTGVEMLLPLRGHDHVVRSIAFSPDGSKIVSGSDDKTIRVWDASTSVEMLPPL
jgi:WD40 repeat protein